MVAPKTNFACEQAKIYYYDFLFQNNESLIPDHILVHFRQCSHCQKGISELKAALTRSELKKHDSSDIVNMLKLHFSYTEKNIDCKTVKPFLPSFMDESLQISIPTPITTHLDYCPECAKDLNEIGDLKLNDIQLFQLSRLFLSKPEEDNISCSQAKAHIMAFVMMAFHESNVEILNHLCSCSNCREAVYNFREEVLNELLIERGEKSCFLSSRLTNSDIFDFTIPFGLEANQCQKTNFDQSRITHIRRCPFCLEKLQQLHRKVNDIIERPNSDVVTIYNVEENVQPQANRDSDDIYAGYPITVEKISTQNRGYHSRTDTFINFKSTLKRRISALNQKTISKGMATAAMIAVFLSIFLFLPKAEALNLKQLYAAISKIENVHISSYIPNRKESIQEEWISRTFKIKISKINNELVLWDIKNKQLIDDSGAYKMPKDWVKDAQEAINNSLALTPFYTISDIPKGSKWIEVTPESQDIDNKTEIFDLTWTSDSFSDTPEYCKLRFYITTGLDIPYKTEFYSKSPSETEYSLKSYKTIEYLTDSEFTAVRNKYFSGI